MPVLKPNQTDESTIWQQTDVDEHFYEEVRDDDDTSYVFIDFGE
jgi:hypothetical protein